MAATEELKTFQKADLEMERPGVKGFIDKKSTKKYTLNQPKNA